MLELHVLASGSSGNCYCIETDKDLIMIDVGASKIVLQEFLCSRKDKVLSVFITHEHTDHVAGIKYIFPEIKASIYTSRGTARALGSIDDIPQDHMYEILSNFLYDFGTFSVEPMSITHDASEPLAFIISIGSSRIAFLTDLGCITTDHLDFLKDVDTLIIESNYDHSMLMSGPYPRYLKKRVSSIRGHLSNDESHNAIAHLSSKNLVQCFLAHVSEKNNDYSLLDKMASFYSAQYGVSATVLRQKTVYSFPLSKVKLYK